MRRLQCPRLSRHGAPAPFQSRMRQYLQFMRDRHWNDLGAIKCACRRVASEVALEVALRVESERVREVRVNTLLERFDRVYLAGGAGLGNLPQMQELLKVYPRFRGMRPRVGTVAARYSLGRILTEWEENLGL